ncbi:MAG: YjbQ family protein [Deltaproteobacteria bacterium]|nr:YjbQ family protein [Deltaproteobacteria bacterium]
MNISKIYFDQVNVQLKTGIDIVDISYELRRLIKKSKIINGTLNATVVGSTGSITTIEFEPGVVEDLRRAVNRIAPPDLEYEHEKAWHDGNGHSHVQAALLGSSIALPVRNGRLTTGTWQQVVVINHDNKVRKRKVEVTIIGIVKEE